MAEPDIYLFVVSFVHPVFNGKDLAAETFDHDLGPDRQEVGGNYPFAAACAGSGYPWGRVGLAWQRIVGRSQNNPSFNDPIPFLRRGGNRGQNDQYYDY